MGKNEIIKGNGRIKEKKRENSIKYACDTVCKAVHIKLIYVLAISTRNHGVLTKEKMIKM